MGSPETVINILKDEFADAVESAVADGIHPHLVIKAEQWHEVAQFMRDDERMGFDWLRCITGVDHLEDKLITVVYDLHATQRPVTSAGFWAIRHEIAIRVRVPRDAPHVPSVADVWPAADWHERETYDLLGVIFDGHPNLKRILCCEDWVGFPLRKDYEFPLEYHGIPATTEMGQTRPQH